jgi:hypothetical protein
MNRRGFLLGSILAAGLAPAIVKAEILMPVRQIIVPPRTVKFRRYAPGFDFGRDDKTVVTLVAGQGEDLRIVSATEYAGMSLAQMHRIKAEMLRQAQPSFMFERYVRRLPSP